MNKYIYILFSLFLFTSCNDFLEEEPKGEITELYSLTEEGAGSVVLTLYESNRDLVEQLAFFGPGGSDLYTYGTQGVFDDRVPAAHYNDNIIVDNSRNMRFWRALYNCVNISNYAVYSIENSSATEENKTNWLAETKALRAFYYWLIVETYGPGAHFSLEHTTNPVTEGFQPGEGVIYTQILSDIDAGLAQNLNYSEFGRLNMGVMKTIKAKILLSLAGHSDAVISATGLSKNECYMQARDLCEEVISDHGYALLDDFEEVFSAFNQENSEVIWSIQYTEDKVFNTGGQNRLHRYWVPWYNKSSRTGAGVDGLPSHSTWYGREYRWIMPTLFGIQVFEDYDLRKKGTFQTVWYRIEGARENEPTYGDTIRVSSLNPVTQTEVDDYAARGIELDGLNHVYDLTTGLPTPNGRSIYNTLTKHLDPTREAAKDESGHKDVIFLRLGEVYLMQAEAEFHLGNNNAVPPLVNAIRQRAIAPGFEEEMNVEVGDITLDFLLDEYARETSGELFRWYTLKRNGALVDRVRRFNPDCSDDIQDYHVNRPIPQEELNLITNEDFVQNPGYFN